MVRQAASTRLLHLCGHSMGTTWSVKAVAAGLAVLREVDLRQALDGVLNTIVAQMSHWEDDSLLNRINRAPPGWYQVAPEFFEVMSCAVQTARFTDGAYDPTVGELVNLWGFGAGQVQAHGGQRCLPDACQIAAARARAGWQKLHLNAEHRGVWQPGGVTLDFSAIAKGYGVDAMAQVLERHGVEHYLAELGGELRARGQRPDGQPWRLHVETPQTQDAALPIVLNNAAIATSGDWRRYFLHAGRRYAHTVDPHTGWALQNDLASVSVVHSSCMVADALSTALLCMGGDDGLAFARQHGIAALFLRRRGGAGNLAVQWSDPFYRLAHPDAGGAA